MITNWSLITLHVIMLKTPNTLLTVSLSIQRLCQGKMYPWTILLKLVSVSMEILVMP